jgi:hypothetical protein
MKTSRDKVRVKVKGEKPKKRMELKSEEGLASSSILTPRKEEKEEEVMITSLHGFLFYSNWTHTSLHHLCFTPFFP